MKFPLVTNHLLALSTQLILIDRVRPYAFDHLEDLVADVKFVVERGTYAAVFAFYKLSAMARFQLSADPLPIYHFMRACRRCSLAKSDPANASPSTPRLR